MNEKLIEEIKDKKILLVITGDIIDTQDMSGVGLEFRGAFRNKEELHNFFKMILFADRNKGKNIIFEEILQ